MELIAILGVVLLMGVVGRRPNRASYALIAVAALGVSVYEYLK